MDNQIMVQDSLISRNSMAHLYEIFSGEELKIAEKIQQRRYQMLVHSYIYYELDNNIVSDSKWSQWAVELAHLQNEHPDIARQVIYADDFANWDGSTGAFLDYAKPNIVSTALKLLGVVDEVKKPAVVTPVKKITKTTTRKKLF